MYVVRSAASADATPLSRLSRIAGAAAQTNLANMVTLAAPLPPTLASATGVLQLREFLSLIRGGGAAYVTAGAGAGKSIFGLMLTILSCEDATPDQPVIVVVAAHNWHKPLIRRGWRQTTGWAAAEIAGEFPSLAPRSINSLIRAGSVIVCFDGLDEVQPDRRPALARALEEYRSSGLGLVVLGRPLTSAAASTVGETTFALRGLDAYRLRPLIQSNIEAVLSQRRGWVEAFRRAPHASSVTRLFGNPLHISVAIATWSDGETPVALFRSADPEQILWKEFLARRLSSYHSARAASLGHEASVVALLARQRALGDFRSTDLYSHPRAALLSALALSLATLPAAYAFGVMGSAAPVLVAVYFALSQHANALYRARLRWVPQLPWWLLLWTVLFVAASLGTIIGVTLHSLIELKVRTDGGLSPALFYLLDAQVRSHWWNEYGSSIASAFSPWVSLVSIAFVPLAMMRLGDTRTDFAGSVLPSVVSQFMAARAIGVVLILLGYALRSWLLVMLGALAVAPLVNCAMARLLLTLSGEIGRRGLRPACDHMCALGVLRRVGRLYRFRHEELLRVIALSAVQRLGNEQKLSTYVLAATVVGVLDERMRRAKLGWFERLVDSVLSAYPRLDTYSASTLAIYLDVVREDRPAAEHLLRTNIRQIARNPLVVQLAELLELRGEAALAKPYWSYAVKRGSGAPYVLNRWIRHNIRVETPLEALATLADQRRLTASSRAYVNAYRASLLCRYGTPDEQQRAHHALAELSVSGIRSMSEVAAVEAARYELEVMEDLSAAHATLARASQQGMVGSLLCIRRAVVEKFRGNDAQAQWWARLAFDSWGWTTDPNDQLEMLLFVAMLCEDLRETALASAKSLVEGGWRLYARDASRYESMVPSAVFSVFARAFEGNRCPSSSRTRCAR